MFRDFDHVGFFLFPVLWIRSYLRSRIMFTTLAHAFSPVLADGPYIYWGGGLGLVVVIVVIVLLLRR